MAGKKPTSSAKNRIKYLSFVQKCKHSATESDTDSGAEESNRNGRASLVVMSRGLISVGLSSDTTDYKAIAEVAHKLAEYARKAAISCRSAVEIATIAVSEGQKRIDTTLEYAESLHPSHASHYLDVVNKYTNAVNLMLDRVRKAEEAVKKAQTAADNATKAENTLMELAEESKVSKDAEKWANCAMTAAYHTKIDAYKAAYVALKVTDKFWQIVNETINLEKSFPKLTDEGTSESSIVLNVMVFMLGWTLIIFNYLNSENDSRYILFMNRCALIAGSAMMGLIRIMDYCRSGENPEEKMISRALEEIEEHLRPLDDYFIDNGIMPPPFDSSGDESDDSRVHESIPLNEVSRN